MGNIITVCISSKQGSSGRSGGGGRSNGGGGRSERSRGGGVYTGGGGGGKIAYQNKKYLCMIFDTFAARTLIFLLKVP